MGKYEISAFYFPNFHTGDKHNEKYHGYGWSEWELMRCARPRFDGHEIPVPLWGYEDESDISVIEKKIKTAADYGVTNLLFDWYWYEDGPFLNKPLDEAFLKAKNTNDIKFSLMWANHDWTDIHPVPRAYLDRQRVEHSGKISRKAFFEGIDYIINNYFTKENYFKLDGGLFLSFYEINRLVDTFGSLEGVKNAILEIRGRVKDKGLGELHLNAIVWGCTILAGESEQKIDGSALKEIGFDSVTSYVWIHEHSLDEFPTVPYTKLSNQIKSDFDRLTEKYKGIPYYPNVTCGWDSSPRACQTDTFDNSGYPFMSVLSDNTPKEFENALISVKEALDNSDLKTKMLTVNAWNEWTEGSYLEPDTKYGYAKLEAIKKVFKQ